MAKCSGCGYVLQEFETECPRCGGRATQPAAEGGEVQPSAPVKPAAPQPRRRVTKAELGASGALAGAIYGAIALIFVIIVDRVLFGGSESRHTGLLVALIGAAIAGAIIGGLIGLAAVLARSTPAGIAVGAVTMALLKAFGVSGAGFGAGFTVLAMVMGLIYGAIIGWAVASSVMKSIKWDQIE